MRLIVANLDCESGFAADAGLPAPRLPGAVMQRISAAGTLLAALGRPGDALWTPLAVDPARLAPASSLGLGQGVRLCSGALPAAPRARARDSDGDGSGYGPGALLAWGETRAVAALRAPALRAPTLRGAEAGEPAPDDDWLAGLWRVHAEADVARRCNDRRFCFALTRELGLQLPGAALLGSVEALEAHLAAGNADAGHDQAWVLEAPFSASGRLRLRRRGAALDQASRTRAARLFAQFGTLCFQPWVERVLDFGCLGVVEAPGRWRVLPPHGLMIDRAGVFRGVTVAAADSANCAASASASASASGSGSAPASASAPEAHGPWLDASERAAVTAAATAVARALAEAGCRGAFGIDGFAYRLPGDGAGSRCLLPVCEINARLSFGFVAHALARALGVAHLRLCLGSGPVPAGAHAGAQIVPLLHPGTQDDTSAWAETR